jgi:hypothetical protein
MPDIAYDSVLFVSLLRRESSEFQFQERLLKRERAVYRRARKLANNHLSATRALAAVRSTAALDTCK